MVCHASLKRLSLSLIVLNLQAKSVVIDCYEYSISRLSSLLLMSSRETLASEHAFSITRIVNYFVALWKRNLCCKNALSNFSIV